MKNKTIFLISSAFSLLFAHEIMAEVPVSQEQKPMEVPKELQPEPVTSFKDEQAKDIVRIMNNYIKSNPDKFMQLMQMAMQFHEAKQEEKTRELLEANRDILVSNDNTIVLGNPKGTVTMVLIADPLCPNCRTLESMLRKVIKQQPSLKVIMHLWPFVKLEDSLRVTLYLHSAWKIDPKAFLKFHEALLATDKIPNDDLMKSLLLGSKYDFDKVKTLAESLEIRDIVDNTIALSKKLELPGAPILLVREPSTNKMLVVPPVGEPDLNKIVADLTKATAALSARAPSHQNQQLSKKKTS